MSIFDNMALGLEGARRPLNMAMADGYDDVEAEFVSADMAQLLQEMETEVNETDIVMNAAESYCDTLQFLSKMKLETQNEKVLANALGMLAGNLVDNKDDINAIFAGLESGSDEAGLERRYVRKIRDTVKKVIDWFIAQYQRIKKIVVDFFNKYFGSIERLQKQVEAIKTKAGEMSDYSIDASTVDIGDFVQPFYRRGKQVTSVSDLITGVDDYTSIVAAYNEGVIPNLDKVVTEFSNGIKTIDVEADKVDLSKIKTDMMDKHDELQGKAFKKILTQYTNAQDPRFPNQNVMSTKKGLLGNRDLFVTSIAGENNRSTLAGRAAAINASDIRLMNWKPEKKNRDKVSEKSGKFTTLTTQDVGNLLSAVEGCLEQVYVLARGEDRQKCLSNLDDGFSQYEKLKSGMSREQFSPELRQTLQMVGNQLTKFRRLLMDVPLNFCNDSRTVCAAMARLASTSLSSHKKPDAA